MNFDGDYFDDDFYEDENNKKCSNFIFGKLDNISS